jgi:hemerythrin-like domain-containing protein
MDVLDVIKKEHREVSAMLAEADKCDPGDARLLALAKKIEKALTTHVKIEERLLYAKLRDRSNDEDELVDVFEAYTEHDVANHLIELLKSGRKPDEKFKAEMQVLGESVKHHVAEEESKVFAIAREVIDLEERDELAEQWARARKRADGQGSNGHAASTTKRAKRKRA